MGHQPGIHEALELRDRDEKDITARVLKAVKM